MYLIRDMIERGICLDEILILIQEGRINASEEEIVKEFQKEIDKIREDDEKVKDLIVFLRDRKRTDIRANRIYQEYRRNGMQFRAGQLSNIYNNPDILQNDMLLAFFINRLKVARGIKLKEYNKGFFDEIRKKVRKKLEEYGDEHDEKRIELQVNPSRKKEEVLSVNKDAPVYNSNPERKSKTEVGPLAKLIERQEISRGIDEEAKRIRAAGKALAKKMGIKPPDTDSGERI